MSAHDLARYPARLHALGLPVLLAAGVAFDRYVDRKIRQHLRRAADIPYLPVEAALRRHPANCRKIEHRVTVPRQLG